MSTKQQRRTARRKARQIAAFEDLDRRMPGACYTPGLFGTPIKVRAEHIPALPQTSKQRLIEGYKTGWRRG